MQHQTDKRDVVEADQRFGQPFIVPRQSAESRCPGETSFNYPAPRQQDKAMLRLGELDDFQTDAVLLGRLRGVWSRVALVDERHFDVLPGDLLDGLRQL